MATTTAPQQRIGTFAAVAGASGNCEEGWREVPDSRKTLKTEGWGQNSQKRVTYSLAGVREKQRDAPQCYRYHGFGHL